jgi:alpha-maltose-1-phosphate synthase
MRVAHLLRKYNPSEWGGTESAMLQLTSAMARQGVDASLYAPGIARGPAHPDPFADAGFPVRRFRASVPIWGISPEMRSQMVAVGGNMISFDLIGSLWRDRNLDLIHSHAQGRLGAIGRVVARGRRLPFVISVHGGAYDLPAAVREGLRTPARGGLDWGKPLGMVLRARSLLSEADAIIAYNPREASLIRDRHPGRRVVAESHGIDTDLFSRDCRAAATASHPELGVRPFLLTLGRIDPVKNQEWLVNEAAELARRHPGILLVFVGACTHGEYGDALRRRIEREGLQDTVRLLGSLPSGDPVLIGLLQLARAVVLPSTSETFGIVILEAWAAGTTVISSSTSGALGRIRDGIDGFLFNLERPAGFHAALDMLMRHTGLAERMGEKGRSRAVAEFDTSVCARRMRLLYEELVHEKNALRHTQGR